jgi:predicted Zn-ribbon and HTH transcriptional regulator
MPPRSKYKPEQLCDLINNIHPDLNIVDPYRYERVSQNKKYTFHCVIHDYEYEAILQSVLKGHGCKKCGNERGHQKLKKSRQQVVDSLLPLGIVFVDDKYVNSRCHIHTFECMVDGHRWKSTVNNVLRGLHGCSVCSNMKRRTTAEVQIALDERYDSTIKMIDNFKSVKTKHMFECTSCGHHFETTVYPLLNTMKGCPRCSSSIGEQHIANILTELEVQYEREVHFITSTGKRMIVDFWLPKHKIVFEYNGEQHYKPVRFGGMSQELAEQALIKQKKRDKALQNYCYRQDIKLIVIKYTTRDRQEMFEMVKKQIL